MIYPKHQQLDHARAKKRIKLCGVTAWIAYTIPHTSIGTVFSDKFKYGRFKNALSNLNYERSNPTTKGIT